MDETGFYILFGLLGIVAIVAAIWIWELRGQRRQIQSAVSWPITEATIESGAIEEVSNIGGRTPMFLPVFAFSHHVADNYYSGRFSLSHLNTDADELIRRMIGRKIQIRCNTSSPDMWFIPDEHIEGCKVEQKLGPHLVALYPKE